MPGISNLFDYPLEMVDKIFESSVGDTMWHKKVEDYFSNKLTDSYNMIDDFSTVHANSMRNHQLIKFKCMIQDMLDPEIFVDCCKIRNNRTGNLYCKTSRFRDTMLTDPSEEPLLDSSSCVTKDRHVYRCIPIPACNYWTIEDQKLDVFSDETGKRKCIGEESGEKRLRTETNGCSSSNPYLKSLSCIIKMYQDFDVLLLNDMAEFIGILNLEPEECEMETDELDAAEDKREKQPSIHVLSWRKLSHCNPLLPISSAPESVTMGAGEFGRVRELLLSVLTQSVSGNVLIAEFLLSHLISSVYTRKDSLALGKFSFNLFNVPAASTWITALYNFIEKVSERSLFLPLTLERLNQTQFVPCKDYEKECLVTGLLQLASNTHLVVDETQLSSGMLDANGVKNLAALSHMISWQRVSYNFKYHQLEYDSNVPVLILSEGKTVLPFDAGLPVPAASQLDDTAFRGLSADQLDLVRKYLTLVKSVDYCVGENMKSVIEQDFVMMRQQDQSVSGNDLHKLLSFSRLLAVSCGHTSLTPEFWDRAKSLDLSRRESIRTFTRD